MLRDWMVFARAFFFNYHLPTFKARYLIRILDLNGFDGREYGKDTLLILCLTIKQTTRCCKKTSCLSFQTHVHTAQFRNTQVDSCRLNSWHPTETKRVLTRKCQTFGETNFLLFPTQLKGKIKPSSSEQNRYFPNKYNDSARLAVNSFTLLNSRDHLHPVLYIFYISIKRLLGSFSGHLLHLLVAQASKTLYFSIARPLKAALVHCVIQFFISYLKGRWSSGVSVGGGDPSTDEPFALGTNLGFCFDVSGWFSLSSACHAQWEKSKPDLTGC